MRNNVKRNQGGAGEVGPFASCPEGWGEAGRAVKDGGEAHRRVDDDKVVYEAFSSVALDDMAVTLLCTVAFSSLLFL